MQSNINSEYQLAQGMRSLLEACWCNDAQSSSAPSIVGLVISTTRCTSDRAAKLRKAHCVRHHEARTSKYCVEEPLASATTYHQPTCPPNAKLHGLFKCEHGVLV